MRRPLLTLFVGLLVVYFSVFSLAKTKGDSLLALTGSTFQNSLSRTFRRRSSRVGTVSTIPCIQRNTEEKCKEGSTGKTCYWDAHGKRCTENKPNCIDDDNGLNFFRASTAYGLESAADTTADAHLDYCENVRTGSGKVVTEYYCTVDGLVAYQAFRCPLWCEKDACQIPKGPERDAGMLPPLTQRVVDLVTGVFPYNSISTSSYESEIAFTPRYAFLVQRFIPSVSACGGQCTYEVTITDSARRVVTKFVGKVKDGKELTASLDLPIRLDINKRYYILQRFTAEKSITFGTTGPIVDNPRVKIDVTTSRSGNTDYKKWGTAVFAIDGLFVK